LIDRDDIDLIDIVTPNNSHAEIAIAAAEAGKHVFCEKSLSLTLDESKRMLEAVKKNNAIHMVNYNYRFAPAVQYAKKLIDEGKLGKIYHMRAHYLQDWIMVPNFPLVWRLEKSVCVSGSHGDLAAHLIDLARFLVGEYKEVSGLLETFIKERPAVAASSGLRGSLPLANSKKWRWMMRVFLSPDSRMEPWAHSKPLDLQQAIEMPINLKSMGRRARLNGMPKI
jgi:predicted dehydrogenase